MLNRLLARLARVLDSEGVVFFQSLVYVHFAVAGLYCLLVADDLPAVLAEGLGSANRAWPWLCVLCTVCLIGKVLSANPERTRYWVYTTGLILQFLGDMFAMGAFGSYVLATAHENSWGRAVVAAFVFMALTECAFFLCWRDIRRIMQAEKRVRRRSCSTT